MKLENETLIRDLVRWIADEPKPYAEVMDAWRTSCPRLSVWEDAVDAGLVHRRPDSTGRIFVWVTPLGLNLLRSKRRPATQERPLHTEQHTER